MIKMKNLYSAWIYSMQSILTSVNTIHIEDYLELRNFKVDFTPDGLEELQNNHRIMEDYEEMKKVFFTQLPNLFGHNYSKTILGPKMGRETAINDIIQMLSKTSTTRKAVLSFLPYGDEKVPCINLIHFLIRNNKLEITYFSRGQDMYRKFPCDAMCIIDYGKQIATAMNMEISKVSAIITSAHIYEKNIIEAKRLISDCYSKKIVLTGNGKKYEKYLDLLQKNGIALKISPLVINEIQSLNSDDVVKSKAKFAYEEFGYPVWVDDVSLHLDAYPLFPGPYTKFWLKQVGIEGIKNLLNGKSKKAKIVCKLCSFDGENYNIIEGENFGYLDLERKIENLKMPLNSIFICENSMKHREMAIYKLIDR